MKVSVLGVRVAIDGVTIVADTTVDVASGEVHGLVGPNGSGKSTLLRCMYRSLKPAAGAVLLGCDDLWRGITAREAALARGTPLGLGGKSLVMKIEKVGLTVLAVGSDRRVEGRPAPGEPGVRPTVTSRWPPPASLSRW